MQRPFRRVVILAALVSLPLLPIPLQAREDSASLLLKKTAVSHRVHVVKKGESIRSILRRGPGNEPVTRALLKRLNPEIPDLNRIYPGQKIVLPLPGRLEPSESISESDRETASAPVLYRIAAGDSISRILLSELNLKPSEVLPAYRVIRKLNPEIADLNRLPTGQPLRLPPRSAPPSDPLQTLPGTTGTVEAKSTTLKSPESAELLAIIRPVIHRMRGTVTAAGNYFIPLQESTQITIDCTMIPVVELDDGTTVLLDYGNRLSESLKGLIRQSWKNYAFLAAEELQDALAALQGIIRHSRSYRMAQPDRPLTLTAKPEIQLFPDWLITRNDAAGGTPYRQGLFLLDHEERPLSADAVEFIEKCGVTVTEITGNRALPSIAPPPMPRPSPVDLHGLKGIAFVEKLLTTLGEAPIRNAEVIVFDQARNGFNLSITADLLIRKGGKQLILQTKKLPAQFLQILREAGTEVIPIGEAEQGRSLIESVLQGVGIPVSYGFFLFRIPEEGKRPRLTTSFSALRAMAEGAPVYLVDFDLPPAATPLLQGPTRGRIARY